MELKEYLESRCMSYLEFSKLIGVTPGAVGHYCLKRRMPHLLIAMKIKEATKGKVDFLDLISK
jgi:transcriptional regulator with XRE-family HTH domain